MVNSCIDNTKLITASWQYKPVQFRQPGFNATISLSLSRPLIVERASID